MSDQEFKVFILFMFSISTLGLSWWSLKSIKTVWMFPFLTFVDGFLWAFFIAALMGSPIFGVGL